MESEGTEVKYEEFLHQKIKLAERGGFEIDGNEINPDYFRDGVAYLRTAEKEISMPTLFDFEDVA